MSATIWDKQANFATGYPGNTYPRLSRVGLWQAETLAYETASGATATRALDDLVRALKDNGHYANSYLIPYGTANNAPSGTTLYHLGGWSGASDMTITGTPTRSAAGTTFTNGNYGTITLPGLRTSTDCMFFNRIAPATLSVADAGHAVLLSFGSSGSSGGSPNKAFNLGTTNANISGETTAIVIASVGSPRIGAPLANFSWAANEDFVEVWRAANGGNTKLWKNDTQATLSLTFGTVTDMSPSNPAFVDDNLVYIHASKTNNVLASASGTLLYKSQLIVNAVLTDVQRNQYRALIAAL